MTGGDGRKGTIVVSTTPTDYTPASGTQLRAWRVTDRTQEVAFVENDNFPSATMEDSLDRLTMLVQELETDIKRGAKLSKADHVTLAGVALTLPSPDAGKLMIWNDDEDGFDNAAAADIDLAVVTPFIETLLDDTTAAAARTTLGLGTGDSPTFTNETLTGYLDLTEIAEPASPAANVARVRALDDGAGVTTVGFKDSAGNVVPMSHFTQAGTGAITRTQQAKLRETFSVRDFGALGDGTTNDAAAFTAAITAVDALSSGGGLVRVPAGVYMLGSEVTIPAGVFLVGDGSQGSIIRPLATILSLFHISGGLSGVRDCNLENISARATSGIRCTKGADNIPIEISGNYFASFSNGIAWTAGDRPYFYNNTFVSNTNCILMTEDGRAGWIRNNYMLGGNGISSAFTTQQCEGCFITNNQIYPTGAGNIGVYFEGGLHNVIESNIIDITGAGGYAIYLAGNADPISHIKIKNNWCAGGSGGGAGLRSVGNVIGLSSSGNTYTSNNTSSAIGIDCTDLQRGEFIGDVTYALTGKAYQFANCDFISVRDCKFQNGAQGTEDGNCSILWDGSEGVPTARSNSSAYVSNWLASKVNNPNLEGSTTGNPVELSATGTDTNISVSLRAKGSGTVLSQDGILSNDATKAIGYATGAGGTVTQGTSKATTVVLNKVCGEIITHNATLNAGVSVIFELTNSVIAAADVVVPTIRISASVGAYRIETVHTQAGLCYLKLTNTSGSNLSDAVTINFAVFKVVAA